MEESVLSMEEAFGDQKDPRSRASTCDLTEMLRVALCAIRCGADGWVGIQTWGEEKVGRLRQYVPLPHGASSHDTFGRVFAALDPNVLKSVSSAG